MEVFIVFWYTEVNGVFASEQDAVDYMHNQDDAYSTPEDVLDEGWTLEPWLVGTGVN